MANGAFIAFNADRTNIQSGECVTFHWKVENVREVYFFAEGQRWKDHGVTGEEQRRVCPPHTTTYKLRVVKRDNSVEIRQIPIQVQAGAPIPVISRFKVRPRNEITLGQCVTIRWTVEGNAHGVRITANGRSLWDHAPLQGEQQDCPSNTGAVTYAIEAHGPGGASRTEKSINVLGGVFWVTVLRDEATVLDQAPFTGTVQDCPPAGGQVLYRLLAYNKEDKLVKARQTITVG
jgi:plastocyanin